MVLGPGRYRAEVSVSRNLDCSYGRYRSTNAIFFPETMSGTPMVSWMNEIADSYSDFEVFTLRHQVKRCGSGSTRCPWHRGRSGSDRSDERRRHRVGAGTASS